MGGDRGINQRRKVKMSRYEDRNMKMDEGGIKQK